MIPEQGLSSLQLEDAPLTGHPTMGVNLILERHRLSGELMFSGVPRRLVDILNAMDSPIVRVRNAELRRSFSGEANAQSLGIVHIHSTAILLALPRVEVVPQSRALEAVTRVAVPAMVVLPGFEVSGNVHVPPDVDPASSQVLASKQFIPLTSARIMPTQNGSPQWSESIVLVNLSRVLLFAPLQAEHPDGL